MKARTMGDAAVRALVVAIQKELGREKDMRLAETNATWCNMQSLAETIELRKGFERRLELLTEESFRVGYDVIDKVQKLDDELVAMPKELVAADDAIMEPMMVMKNSIETERVERERTNNDIKTQINNSKQEITEERDESENDTSETETTLSPRSQASDTEVRSHSTSWSTQSTPRRSE